MCSHFVTVRDLFCMPVETNTTVIIPVNSPPSFGSCTVSPDSGYALKTLFSVECKGFMDSDMPLTYEVDAYQDLGGKGNSVKNVKIYIHFIGPLIMALSVYKQTAMFIY